MSPSTGLGEPNSHIVTVCLLVFSLCRFKKNCDCLDSFEIIAQLSKTTVNGRLERPCHIEAGLNRVLSARGRNG